MECLLPGHIDPEACYRRCLSMVFTATNGSWLVASGFPWVSEPYELALIQRIQAAEHLLNANCQAKIRKMPRQSFSSSGREIVDRDEPLGDTACPCHRFWRSIRLSLLITSAMGGSISHVLSLYNEEVPIPDSIADCGSAGKGSGSGSRGLGPILYTLSAFTITSSGSGKPRSRSQSRFCGHMALRRAGWL